MVKTQWHLNRRDHASHLSSQTEQSHHSSLHNYPNIMTENIHPMHWNLWFVTDIFTKSPSSRRLRVSAFGPHRSGVLGARNLYFMKPGPKMEKSEIETLAFSCVQLIPIFSQTMRSSPQCASLCTCYKNYLIGKALVSCECVLLYTKV